MSLPGADELFRTTGGMALSPSLASRSAAEAPRPETARAVNGVGEADDAEGTDVTGGAGSAVGGEGPEHAEGGAEPAGDRTAARRAPRRTAGAQGAATVPAPAQPGGQGATTPGGATTAAAKAAQGGRPAAPAPRQHVGAAEDQTGAAGRPRPRSRAPRRPTGRERHDEKITVYVSAEELMDLEHTRLVLRGEHGLAVDRGRIVREAIAVVLADLEQRGEASILVRRLRGR
ncbi:hypothetical protein ACFVVL_33685 [Kitasatospora sp. NPDC058115]|uniref:hypothetical protein n=1 Tax=Kitasatospora sp. NPDC058115 TaxID=3346347 RepID=UPI0036DBA3BF